MVRGSNPGGDFLHPSRPALGPGIDHPLPYTAEVKERVELYLLPLWAFMACSRVNFTFTLCVKYVYRGKPSRMQPHDLLILMLLFSVLF
jgi:hypothetical protein